MLVEAFPPEEYQPTAAELAEWNREFEAAAARPLPLRWKYACIKTYKPVMDDASYRSWESTADCRAWCNENLPSWLGYGEVE